MKNSFELLMLGPDVNANVCPLMSVWEHVLWLSSPKRNELWDPLGAETRTPGGHGHWGPRRAGRDLNKGKGPNDVVKCVSGKPLTGPPPHRVRPGSVSSWVPSPSLSWGPGLRPSPAPSTCPHQHHPGPRGTGSGRATPACGWAGCRVLEDPQAACAFFFRKTCG